MPRDGGYAFPINGRIQSPTEGAALDLVQESQAGLSCHEGSHRFIL